MSRRYTAAEKSHAIEQLEKSGDLRQTSLQTGIPVQRLRHWERQARERQAQQEAALLDRLRRKLLTEAETLVEALAERIESAPLNQCASTLNVVIEKYLKLREYAPQLESREQVIRIEYVDPDGSLHQTPYWARTHSEGADALPSRGVWSPLWQNGSGQNGDQRSGAAPGARLVAFPYLSDGEPGLAGLEDDAGERLWDVD
jgi:transposase-like protein